MDVHVFQNDCILLRPKNPSMTSILYNLHKLTPFPTKENNCEDALNDHMTCLLITPWSRVLLEKLTALKLVKKFPAFYGTRRFITTFTSARHLYLSRASSIQFITHIPLPEDPAQYYPPIYTWVSQVVSFPQVSPPNPLYASPLPHTCHVPRPSHSSRSYHPHNIG